MQTEIYFDNSATTKPFCEVLDHYNIIAQNYFGNPSSLHKKGLEAEKILKDARKKVSLLLAVDSSEIIFTSSGTESNNMAILGYLNANVRKGSHIITSKIEHPSILEVYKTLHDKGYKVDYIDVDSSGIIKIDELLESINKETALVSLTLVNNEIGTVLPIEEIIRKIKFKNPNTAVHIDAVQAFGKIQVRPKIFSCDLLSISSHKIHGPKGVGALFVDKNIKIAPLFHGGGQENNLRPGTENVAAISSFALACDIIHKNMDFNYSNILELNNYFRKQIIKNFKFASINSYELALPYILNVSFEGVKAEVLLHSLEMKNIYVSTVSACSSKKNKKSHVLTSIGISNSRIDGSIRFSFNASNSICDVDICIEALREILPKININRVEK